MKNLLILFFLTLACLRGTGQGMDVKKHNFTTFSSEEKAVTPALEKESSPAARQHPEFGIKPYNAQCTYCAELIDKRTVDSRSFIDTKRNNYIYTQQSHFPLHYTKFEGDVWHTIDSRLKPANETGIYTATNQPNPTKYDFKNKVSSITVDGYEFIYNRNVNMYFFEENSAYTRISDADYTHTTVGDDGVEIKNAWPGINMQLVYMVSEIRTDYIIEAPLQLPVNNGWMVIEDHFTLPEGYSVTEADAGGRIGNKYYRGDYLIKNEKGDTVVIYGKPVYYDARANGLFGQYELLRTGNSYTVRLLVPVEWLKRTDLTYPLTIDPALQAGFTKIGDYRSVNPIGSAGLGFTTMSLGSCDYHMSVTVPGETELKDTYVELEYQLTYDNQCGNPPLLAPFCTFSQVTMEVVCDQCNQTTGLLACNPAQPPFTGTCTTDSNLVPGASPLLVNNLNPNFLTCIPAQCPDYNIAFTLKNRDSICGDVCGYLCARGNIWQTLVTACYVEGFITQDKTQVCPGEPVTFTAHPDCGVPPYSFIWMENGNIVDTITGTPDIIRQPQSTIIMSCVIVDACGRTAVTNDLTVNTTQAPTVSAGPDQYLCQGGGVRQIAGSASGGTIQWTGQDATVEGYLSGVNGTTPVATVPATAPDSFFFVISGSLGTGCVSTDTVWFYIRPNPTAIIDTTGPATICANQTVGIGVTPAFSSYLWSNGQTTQNIQVNQAGPYSVIVTDQYGCKDTSDVITVNTITIPDIHVYPDTTIHFGDSVTLYSDFNLASVSVDSFYWYPVVGMACPTCVTPVVAPARDQLYGLIAKIGGCTVGDSTLIKVILPNNYFIPNIFTPNGDGANDEFYILSQSGVRVLLFQVFNRTGEKVHDGTYPWNGEYKDKPAPPGVYVYMFKLGLFDGHEAILRKGSVTLMR